MRALIVVAKVQNSAVRLGLICRINLALEFLPYFITWGGGGDWSCLVSRCYELWQRLCETVKAAQNNVCVVSVHPVHKHVVHPACASVNW